MMIPELVIEVLGFAGAGAVIAAFWLINQKKIVVSQLLLHCLNLFGSVAVGINGWYHDAMPTVIINMIWALIAAGSWWRNRRNFATQAERE